MKPTPGFCAPVSFRRTRDADTVEVSIPGSPFVWAIRLLDVWAPELHTGEQTALAAAGRTWLSKYLSSIDPPNLLLFVPLPVGENLLKSLLTFDRIIGQLWAGDVLVNELIVEKGYASSKKGGHIGE